MTAVFEVWNTRRKSVKSAAATNVKRSCPRGSAFPDVEEVLLLWLAVKLAPGLRQFEAAAVAVRSAQRQRKK